MKMNLIKNCTAIENIDLQIILHDLQKNWEESLGWIKTSAEKVNVHQIFAKGTTSLAETLTELLLVKQHHSIANEVGGIVQFCSNFTHLNGLAKHFAAALSDKKAMMLRNE